MINELCKDLKLLLVTHSYIHKAQVCLLISSNPKLKQEKWSNINHFVWKLFKAWMFYIPF